MANTRDVMGEQACLDALVANNIVNFEDDAIKSVVTYAFRDNSKLQSINLPSCTKVSTSGFKGCSLLSSVNLPLASTIGASSFQDCSSLDEIELPSLVTVDTTLFSNCVSLRKVKTGAVAFNSQAFYNCARLRELDCGSPTKTAPVTLASTPFNGVRNLKAFIMRNRPTTVIAFSSSNVPANTINELAYYVDSSILDDFKAANIASVSNKTYALEDYPMYPNDTLTDSWSTIISKCSNGDYETDYTVGKRKKVFIDGEDYYMILIAKDVDVLASDGTTTVPTSWLVYKRGYTPHRMNPTNSSGAQGTGTNGGWEYSEMRSWLNNTVLQKLPEELIAGIKEVRKTSDYVAPGTTIVSHDQVTSDKLWIPSAREVIGGESYEQTGAIYTYYTEHVNSYRLRYTNETVDPCPWHLRTAYNNNNFVSITNAGGPTNYSASYNYEVIFGFCI